MPDLVLNDPIIRDGNVVFGIERSGDTSQELVVQYRTVAVTAVEEGDLSNPDANYKGIQGSVVFEAGATHKELSVHIIKAAAEDRTFYLLAGAPGNLISATATIPAIPTPTVTTITDAGGSEVPGLAVPFITQAITNVYDPLDEATKALVAGALPPAGTTYSTAVRTLVMKYGKVGGALKLDQQLAVVSDLLGYILGGCDPAQLARLDAIVRANAAAGHIRMRQQLRKTSSIA